MIFQKNVVILRLIDTTKIRRKYCQNDGFNDSNAMSASKVVYLANL